MKRWYFYPLAVVYHLITAIRNKMYDFGIFKSVRFRVPIIGVGNLSVGGSGKSPMVMYLAKLLSNNFLVVMEEKPRGIILLIMRVIIKW